MKTYDLSILIPARNEEWISNTVADIIKNKRGNTEVIVGLDGAWAEPGIMDHPDVRILYSPEPLGQRAMTNKICRMSTAKYVAKADAHTAYDEGFDVKLMSKMEDDITMVPVMRNLHVFDWKCENCGMRTYQGPEPTQCRNEECANEVQRFHKKLVWNPKPNPQSSAYRFNAKLQFKYFPELRAKQPREGLQETMSLQGSFFMLTREKYHELNICDESWGSWGNQGSEVAIKTWLSGGRVLCNMDTWYAHLFRTQHGFSFPYPNPASSQDKARQASRDLFLNNKWDKQIRPLSWIVERFWDALKDVQDIEDKWDDASLANLKARESGLVFKSVDEDKPTVNEAEMEIPPEVTNEPTKGILYFTDNELPMKFAHRVRKTIKQIADSKNMELVSSTRKPIPNMGTNVVTNEPRGYLTMFKQILKGLEAMTSDIVFMAEHDVLYDPSHFDFMPEDRNTFYYDTNWWKVHADGLAVHWDADQVSGLCGYRDKLIEYYRERVASFDAENFDRKFEPGSGINSAQWKAPVPHIDIRTGNNLTYDKRSLDHFRNKATAVNFETTTIDKIPGWPELHIF